MIIQHKREVWRRGRAGDLRIIEGRENRDAAMPCDRQSRENS